MVRLSSAVRSVPVIGMARITHNHMVFGLGVAICAQWGAHYLQPHVVFGVRLRNEALLLVGAAPVIIAGVSWPMRLCCV